MSNEIPIPKQAVQLAKKMQANTAIQKMQLENMLLKHLVATLDPEHDYRMDLEKMTLTKVKHEQVQPGTSEEPQGRQEDPAGGKARGFNISDKRSFAGDTPVPIAGGI